MPLMPHIHVIDGESRRRASVARDLISQNVHAEVYEDIDEFSKARPQSGAVLAFDDQTFQFLRILKKVMRSSGHPLPIALYSDRASPPNIVHAMLDGALGYLEWPLDLRQLNQTIERLQTEGQRFSVIERRKADARALIDTLSRRERDVLNLLVKGHSNKTMAATLGISPRTVEIHRGKLMRKFGANNAADVVRMALQVGVEQDGWISVGEPLAA